jgi:integrase
MKRRKSKSSPRSSSASNRFRIGKVSVYEHHGSWWVYFREGGQAHRRKVAQTREEAEQVAHQIQSQLSSNAPTLLTFRPISVEDLRTQFLEYHEKVLHSSVGTVRRYSAATLHLLNFVQQSKSKTEAHTVKPESFAAYLRTIEVAANGHANSARRKLRSKGIRYILATCSGMYNFALKRRHLPPYVGNPFSQLPLDRMRMEDAKPIFVFDPETELKFLQRCNPWEFAVHFTLAKTGMRSGELIHLLIEDVDLESGWIHVRNKLEIGWRIKTGQERKIPIIPELIAVLRSLIRGRASGPVFLRNQLIGKRPLVVGDRRELESILKARRTETGRVLSRTEEARLCRKLWWDAGAIKADRVRMTFLRIMKALGRPDSTCPKSWRHSFATLLQDGNVDPLIRQQVMGHRPTLSGGLGMTANYTHTRPETMKSQVEAALRQWPESLALALRRVEGTTTEDTQL